jgi:hypothetical protein
MAGTQAQVPEEKGAKQRRRPIAGIIALAVLAVVAAAWFWTTRQPLQPDAGIGLPHAVIVVGAGTFIVALLAQVRAMSLWDVLEFLWEMILGALWGVFWLIGAALKGLWNGLCALFSWN